ncbi:hypothetical protein KSF78_0001386 [Schistosoma japonicum]|uniref:Uncharacterized protein n=1 Tax=Schistosoma japonicum TaxID=6182 RepID=C1LFB3_SCHJA|nr:hypothetical protein KSF78_0001386 [Schistosoma japonicum]CAX73391.1 hypothetical protein [Schistosoma japonicum]
MSTRRTHLPRKKDAIYWRYHWKNSDPVMIAKRIGTVNWVLLRDKLNEMNDMHEKEANPHSIRAQIITSQLESMTSGTTMIPTKNEDESESCAKKINKETCNYKGGPYTKGMTPKERKQFFRTTLNQKAREGFRFWVTERPKPTKFGHYSMGAKYTFLGLCNAPRS